MRQSSYPWPHAPTHQLASVGTYMVTAGTFKKAHFFRTRELLGVLQRELLQHIQEFGWRGEAWAVFSNHYHFVAHSPTDAEGAAELPRLVNHLHWQTAICVNERDGSPGRKVWHNYWDTKLSYQKSYLARLNYVHQNPVRHRVVAVAHQYPWCSARWFETTASNATVKSIYRFNTDRVNVHDDFAPIVDDPINQSGG